MTRFFKTLCGIALSLGFAQAASATTYFVRADGGDAAQCTGRADAPYSGSGTAQNCAWKHPFNALPPGGTARIAGGDTLIIGSGSYMMGLGAPDTSKCFAQGSYDCTMANVPAGTASAKTRILGAGHDAGCPAAPQLWGTERANFVLNLSSTSNVEVACLEVTDHSDCIEFHCSTGSCPGGANQIRMCKRDAAPFGTWASTGIMAKGSSNLLLKDVNVHGLANRGFAGAGLNNFEMLRVKLNANGWAGWEGDLGAGSSNSGTIALRQVEIGYNGCTERYPSTEIFGCWGQEGGGYGDGMGTALTGGNWIIEDSHIHHNTSDGIDLLYADGSGSITIRRTLAEANAGNQIKTNGPATIENNIAVGNCAVFQGQYNMKTMDNCRALGNVLSVGMRGVPNERVNVRNNSVTGEGDCLILSSGGASSGILSIQSNALIGQLDYHGNRTGNIGELSCGHYADNSPAQVQFATNLFFKLKSNQCPSGSVCSDPRVQSVAMASFDPEPMAGSPLVNASTSQFVADDFYKTPRPQGGVADIGAVEAATEAGGAVPTLFRHDFE